MRDGAALAAAAPVLTARTRARDAGRADAERAPRDAEALASAVREALAEAEPESSRACDVDVDRLVADALGKELGAAPTKAAVMEAIRRGGGGAPRFSKYLGIIEWRNAIVLWVNVGGPDYDNQFFFEASAAGAGAATAAPRADASKAPKKGAAAAAAPPPPPKLHMTWFAGSRMHAETPVIRRLLLATASERAARETAILLFCRGAEGNGFGKYVFCGRVRPRGSGDRFCDLGARPMRFVWALEDWPSVSQQKALPEILRESGFSTKPPAKS